MNRSMAADDPDGLTDYSPDGVDLTLIRWMLSLTPAERLQLAEDGANEILSLRERIGILDSRDVFRRQPEQRQKPNPPVLQYDAAGVLQYGAAGVLQYSYVHKVILPLVALTAMALSLPAATPAKSKQKGHTTPPSAPTHASRAPHPAPASKSARQRPPKATKAPKASKYTRHGKKTRAAVHSYRYQTTPTPERYQEIQQALAAKGYFHGEVNGTWGPDSIDALKRFQTEQNLMPDGKISSLSLIALGLGPKRLTASKSDTVSPPVTQGTAPAGAGTPAAATSGTPPSTAPSRAPSAAQQ